MCELYDQYADYITGHLIIENLEGKLLVVKKKELSVFEVCLSLKLFETFIPLQNISYMSSY
jgi:hypothetical protein